MKGLILFFLLFKLNQLNCLTPDLLVSIIRKQSAHAMEIYIDREADPCDDFYKFSCGKWEEQNETNNTHSKEAFDGIDEKIHENIASILSEGIDHIDDNSVVTDAQTKAKLYFTSCMKAPIFDRTPRPEYSKLFQSILDKSKRTSTTIDWMTFAALLRRYGAEIFIKLRFNFGIKAQKYIPSIDPISDIAFMPPLTLDDYNSEWSHTHVYNKLLIARVLVIYGETKQKAWEIAGDIMKFGGRLKELDEKYHRNNVKHEVVLSTVTPNQELEKYLSIINDIEVTKDTYVLRNDPNIFREMFEILNEENPETIINYGMVTLLLTKLHIEFQHEPTNQEKFCASKVLEDMKPVVSAMYIKKHYHKGIAEPINDLISGIRNSLKQTIMTSDWLDEKTQEKALEKLEKMQYQIGYKDNITLTENYLNAIYEDLNIEPNNYYMNNINALSHNAILERKQWGTKIRDEDFNVVEAAAHYEPFRNTMRFPAGVLLPTAFHPYYPKFANYGSLGSIIGHEMVNGFDNESSKYNSSGGFDNWLEKSAEDEFKERSKCFVEQYNQYHFAERLASFDVTQTLSENIADNGGIRQAYYAYKRWADENPNDAEEEIKYYKGMGLNPVQLFFLSFGQTWCKEITHRAVNSITSDNQSFAEFRVTGSLSNFDEFAKAFNCSASAKMNPDKKCALW